MNTIFFSPLLMAAAAAAVVFYLMTRGRRTMLQVCLMIAIPTFFGAFLLYTMGHMPENPGVGEFLLGIMRGLFSTGRMFVLEEDYSAFADNPAKVALVQNMVYQLSFWLCHVMALVISFSTVMGVFGQKLICSARLRYGTYDSCTIILGSSEEALTLGENIATHDGNRVKPDAGRLVVYLVQEPSDELAERLADFGAIVLDYEKKLLPAQLRRAGLCASARRIKVLRAVLAGGEESELMSNLRVLLDTALEEQVPEDRLSVYLLSESAWVHSYVHKILDRHFPPEQVRYPYDIYAAGEADLAARHMVLTLPPCDSIQFENGVAQQDFTALVLGLGKTGTAALQRLVLNGQFVGSHMRAMLVDRQMERIRGTLNQSCPGLHHCCELEYYDYDVGSAAFFELLAARAPEVRYVVVALADDELNMEAALLIMEHCRRTGLPSPHFALAISSGDGDGSEITANTVFFSRRNELYSEAVVIREEADRMAVAVNAAYARSSKRQPEPLLSDRQMWSNLNQFKRDSNRATADFIPSMLRLSGLCEAEAASRTKLTEDQQLADVLTETEHLRWNAFHYAMGYRPMSTEEMAQRFAALYESGARGEALEECRRDKERCLHVCLVPWSELEGISSAYNRLFADKKIPHERRFQDDDRAIIEKIPLYLRYKNHPERAGVEP